MQDKRSGRSFLRRNGFIATQTNPRPALSPASLQAHLFPIFTPVPEPGFVVDPDGSQPPDRVETIAWPPK